MGHLAIVNTETLDEVIRKGCISTRGDLGSLWLKTTSDLFSDALCIRKGDLIFPWVVKGEKNENMGFRFVMKAMDVAHYAYGEEYPIQIPIEKIYLEFSSYLSEDKALNLFDNRLLWNAIGKKSLQRPKSITHQTSFEDEQMISLLTSESIGAFVERQAGNYDYSKAQKITISETQNDRDEVVVRDILRFSEGERISKLQLNKLPWISNDCFSYEKTLEAWLCENIDGTKCQGLRQLLMSNEDRIIWFGNYLPYGVQGKNIDFVILTKNDTSHKAYVVELKMGRATFKDYIDHCNQVMRYSDYYKMAFNSYGVDVCVTPVIITHNSTLKTTMKPTAWNDVNIPWIGYSVINSNVTFERLL